LDFLFIILVATYVYIYGIFYLKNVRSLTIIDMKMNLMYDYVFQASFSYVIYL
jgi:hypothetical protein